MVTAHGAGENDADGLGVFTAGGPVDVLVVVAMDEEAAPFLASGANVREVTVPQLCTGGASWWSMDLAGVRAVVTRSGIGLVAAAAATVKGLMTWRCGAVISAGTCGGLGAGVRAGDVVVGTRFVYSGADARAFGYALGQVPGQPEYFKADEGLVRAVMAGVRCSGAEDISSHEPPGANFVGGLAIRQGLVASGDVFVAVGAVPSLRQSFDGIVAADMESTAIAQVSRDYHVPFISLRAVSDLCGPAAGEDFDAHVDDAAARSAVAVTLLAKRVEPFQKNS